MTESTLRVEGLSPRAWLNRCASVWPEYAAQAYNGLTSDDGQGLLKDLTERFEAFDEYIGTCPCVLEPSFVATTRTLLGSLKKFREPMGDDEELRTAAMKKFCANNLHAKAGQIPRRFKEGMRTFIRGVLAHYADVDADPHFGPGAVAERMSQVVRWEQIAAAWQQYDFTDPGDISHWGASWPTTASRLHAVPKDWNKKRLITIEPFLLSYLQHWTREKLWKVLKTCKVAGLRRLATPSVKDPQAAHRALACKGSMDGTLATLDMSDASDGISFNQVAEVFPGVVMADLERSRSELYQIPGESELRPTYMYGGMGNATTFTVETLMFHAACYAIAQYHRLGFKDSFVSCYGDDMIVSTRLAEIIISNNIFDEFGWKINALKSYWRPSSKFRESCGGQFYNGHDVTLLRYQGGYRGIRGLIAYRELIHRAATTARWRPLTWSPWSEQNMPNFTSLVAEGVLATQVPWWPETARAQTRCNPCTQEVEAYLQVPRIPKRVVPVQGLGPVYGALSGQLAMQTGTRRIRGRRAYGIVVPVSNRTSVTCSWVTVGRPEFDGNSFGTVPGTRNEPSDYQYLLTRLSRDGWCV